MKYFWVVALGLFGLVANAGTEQKGKHLFILSGQSNMAGLKPEISFTPAVEAKFGADNILVIKDAQSGQPIRRWYKKWKPTKGDAPPASGDLYDRLIAKVEAVTKDERIRTVTFVWMQGERDARESHGEVYAESFKGLVAQLTDDLGRKDINFVIGRISDFDMSNAKYPHWTKVRDAQVAVAEADPRGAWVDTDGLNGSKNGLHYTAKGYKELGKCIADTAIRLIGKQDK
jgi:hypothetical protein